MINRRYFIVIALILAVIFIFNYMASNQEQKTEGKTITLKVKEENKVFDDLTVKYLSYGHENSSSSPDDPFSANVAAYFLELSDNTKTEPVTIYQEVNNDGKPIEWQNYKIVLLKPESQDKITLRITKVK